MGYIFFLWGFLCCLLLEGFFFFFFCLLSATPMACGDSQARGRIVTAAASLSHSHSNTGFEPFLRTTSQLTATSDP